MSLVLFLLFIAMSAVFSGLEMAYISRQRLSHMSAFKGDMAAFFGTMPSRVLATVLLGNNIAIVGATAAATSFFLGFAGKAESAGLASAATTVVLLIFGELLPKAVARSMPGRFMRIFGPVVFWFWWISRPLIKLLLSMVRVEVGHSPVEEMKSAINQLVQEARISREQARIALSSLELPGAKLGDVASSDFVLLEDIDLQLVPDILRKHPGAVLLTWQKGKLVRLRIKALFAGRKNPFEAVPILQSWLPVSSAMDYLKTRDTIAVSETQGKISGVLTPQSLLEAMVSRG